MTFGKEFIPDDTPRYVFYRYVHSHGSMGKHLEREVSYTADPRSIISRVVKEVLEGKAPIESFEKSRISVVGEQFDVPFLMGEELMQIIHHEVDSWTKIYASRVKQDERIANGEEEDHDFFRLVDRMKLEREEKQENHPVRYALDILWVNIRGFVMNEMNPMSIKRIFVRYAQRANRGWSDSDAWSADYYLGKVIPDMLEHMIEHSHSHATRPIWDRTPDEVRQIMIAEMSEEYPQEAQDQGSAEWWDTTVRRIIRAFRNHHLANHDAWQSYKVLTDEDWAQINEEFYEAGKLFLLYFNHMWD